VITALALLGYAACAAWCAPALLAPLTRRGVSVRAGLAAWLTAMASVLASAAVAIQFSFRTAAADWPQLTQALCRSVAGSACTPGVYGSALYQAGVIVLAASLTLAGAAAAWRYGRRVQRSRAQTRCHARAALLVGHAIAGQAAGVAGPVPAVGAQVPAANGPAARSAEPAGTVGGAGRARTVMLDDPRPAAYCVAGRPAAIVVTSGALAVLDPPQLSAVLAHEHAHLAHGHHALATVTRGLAAALPGIPLFTRGAAEVARLTEMAADDTAARASGRPALVTALIAIATGAAVSSTAVSGTGILGAAVPAGAMAAAARAVPDRVERLLRPPSHARSAAFTAALAVALTLLAAAPPALTLLVAR
jgi:Zn-dependent protease with chaperone function